MLQAQAQPSFLGLCLQNVPGRRVAPAVQYSVVWAPDDCFPCSLFLLNWTHATFTHHLALLPCRPRTQLMVVWALFYFIFWPHNMQDFGFPNRGVNLCPLKWNQIFYRTFIDMFVLWYCYKCVITKKIRRQAMEAVTTVPHQDDNYARVPAVPTQNKDAVRAGPLDWRPEILLPDRQDWHFYSDLKWSQKTISFCFP